MLVERIIRTPTQPEPPIDALTNATLQSAAAERRARFWRAGRHCCAAHGSVLHCALRGPCEPSGHMPPRLARASGQLLTPKGPTTGSPGLWAVPFRAGASASAGRSPSRTSEARRAARAMAPAFPLCAALSFAVFRSPAARGSGSELARRRPGGPPITRMGGWAAVWDPSAQTGRLGARRSCCCLLQLSLKRSNVVRRLYGRQAPIGARGCHFGFAAAHYANSSRTLIRGALV